MSPIVLLNAVKVLKSTSVRRPFQALRTRSLRKELYEYQNFVCFKQLIIMFPGVYSGAEIKTTTNINISIPKKILLHISSVTQSFNDKSNDVYLLVSWQLPKNSVWLSSVRTLNSKQKSGLFGEHCLDFCVREVREVFRVQERVTTSVKTHLAVHLRTRSTRTGNQVFGHFICHRIVTFYR